jgi:type IV pilus assembly protein PilA
MEVAESGGSMDRKGFTLIELLIVVVIIGVLAAIALPKFANTKSRAAVAAMKADLRNLATVQEAYYHDHQAYAPTLATVQADPYAFKISPQNAVILTAGGGGSWRAEASSPGAGSIVCSFAHGTGSPDDGAPSCP